MTRRPDGSISVAAYVRKDGRETIELKLVGWEERRVERFLQALDSTATGWGVGAQIREARRQAREWLRS
jgi:hypothetical protein